MRKVITYLWIAGLLFSCSKAPISSKAMVPLLVDIQLMEAGNRSKFGFSELPKEKWKADYQFICKKHGTDTAEFRKAMQWYEKHPDQLSKMMDNVLSELQKMEVRNKVEKP